jgi:O-antigen/teichoic acid export membrane protein
MPIIYSNSNSNIVKILSNYFSKLWNIVSVFLLVPLYIHYLGIENYGIIGFYAVILGLIGFADAGMSSAVTREFAIDGGNSLKYHILRKIEIIYWSVIILICLLIASFSSVIAHKWLTAEHIHFLDLKNYIILIGIGAGLQLVSSVYFGALFGLGRQVSANIYQIIWTTCKSLLVIVLFELIDSNLYIFLIWQIFCNAFYIGFLRWHTVKKLKKNKSSIRLIPISDPLPKRILVYIGGMTLVSIISSINLQADKLVISYFFSLKIFSFYTIASILSQIPIMISAPLASFVFPIFSRFIHRGDIFNQVFKTFTTLTYLFVFSSSFLIFFYSLEIFTLWSQQPIDKNTANELNFLIKILTLGSILLAMQFPFYYALLANSKTKYTVYQGIFQVLIGVPLLIFFAKYYGLKYAGIPWLLMNLFAFIYLMVVCLGKYINIGVIEFISKYIVMQLTVGYLIAWISHVIYQLYFIPFVIIFLFSGVLSFCLILILDNILTKKNLLSYRHLYNFPRD